MLVSFAAAPALARLLGQERFGVFAAITATSLLLAFSDLGVGQGLVSKFAVVGRRGAVDAQRVLVSNAFAAMLLVALGLIPVAVVLGLSLPLQDLFGTDLPLTQLRLAFFGYLAVFVLGIPGFLGLRVLQARLEGVRANWWIFVSTGSATVTPVLLAWLDASLPVVVVSSIAAPTLINGYQTLTFFFADRDGCALRPHRSLVSRRRLREVTGAGSLFLALNFAIAFAYQSDVLVASSVLGATSAAVLVVSSRVYGLVHQVTSAVWLQLWPSFAEAAGEGDWQWITSSFRRAVLLTAGAMVPVAAVLLLGAPSAIALVFGEDYRPTWALSAGLTIWVVQQGIGFPMAMLLNGLHVIQFQVKTSVSMAFANLALSIYLTNILGVSGPIWASVVTHGAFILVPSALFVRRTFALRRVPVTHRPTEVP